jgi:hypothetical protein
LCRKRIRWASARQRDGGTKFDKAEKGNTTLDVTSSYVRGYERGRILSGFFGFVAVAVGEFETVFLKRFYKRGDMPLQKKSRGEDTKPPVVLYQDAQPQREKSD